MASPILLNYRSNVENADNNPAEDGNDGSLHIDHCIGKEGKEDEEQVIQFHVLLTITIMSLQRESMRDTARKAITAFRLRR